MENDWRLRGQEEYMLGLKFKQMNFTGVKLHAHCEFCWHKFMEEPNGIEDCSNRGFFCQEKKYWVCEECFQEFRNMFDWEVIG